ncbi:MAG: hypothetical protein NW224_23945 [Leptolyngbyaceae cyanobacterium bins.302]|nr:hypothetical protein [Leptolyngbyaceae cyanobacterium bins.302]
MKLETEFRIRLQLMQLEQSSGDGRTADHLTQCCDFIAFSDTQDAKIVKILSQFEPNPPMWVKLFQAPGIFSSHEALLLCQVAREQWLAWVPDHGEIVLDREEFYLEWDGMD